MRGKVVIVMRAGSGAGEGAGRPGGHGFGAGILRTFGEESWLVGILDSGRGGTPGASNECGKK